MDLMLTSSSRIFDSQRINSVRGLACALLVAHHITLSLLDYRAANIPVAEAIDLIFSYFRMPAFAFISGLILGISSSDIESLKFIKKKFFRLIIPFLIVTIILIAGRSLARGDVNLLDIPHYWIYPHSHMWFLPAVFTFFIFTYVFSLFFNLRTSIGSLAFFVFAFSISITPIPENIPFSLGKAAQLFPWFALGIAFAEVKREAKVGLRNLLFIFFAIIASSAVKIFYGTEGAIDDLYRFTFVVCIFFILPRLKILSRIGEYSFSVYLFHGIVISLGIRFMPDSLLLAASGIFILAMIIPMAIEKILRSYFPAALPLIGQDFKRIKGADDIARSRSVS